MIAYLDSSALLRLVLGEPGGLADWQAPRHGVTSALTEVECLRTIDRLRLRGLLNVEETARRRAAVYDFLEALEVIELSPRVIARAAQPFPTPLGTLDALHLSTALLWCERSEEDLALATHDNELALAARSCGLKVIGA